VTGLEGIASGTDVQSRVSKGKPTAGSRKPYHLLYFAREDAGSQCTKQKYYWKVVDTITGGWEQQSGGRD